MASRDATELHSNASSTQLGQEVKSIHAMAKEPQPKGKFSACQSCGKTNHSRENCYFREAECKACHKKGHIQSVCRSKPTQPKVPFKAKPKKVHQLEEGTDFFSIDLQVHQSEVTTNKIWVHPLINNIRTRMELDTGSGLSLMTIRDFKAIFKKSPTLSTDLSIILNTYTGEKVSPLGYTLVFVTVNRVSKTLPLWIVREKVSPLGYTHVFVTVNRVSKTLPLWIVKEGNYPLFGRNWLQHFRLQWHELKNLKVNAASPRSPEATTTADQIKNGLQKLLQTHKEVFSPGIGKAKFHTATLTLKPDARPKFCKARPVPYALVNKVGQEIDNLEKQGILSKVQHSEWATPVVPVLKRSGDVRPCGDFKITTNPALQAEQYTLPRVEDSFANLGSGQKFSKIDLREAYIQLRLNEESRPLTVINTHKGLCAYNRLVFGITSSPAVWQKTIDTILQGMEGVQVNQDDMVITGENDENSIISHHRQFSYHI